MESLARGSRIASAASCSDSSSIGVKRLRGDDRLRRLGLRERKFRVRAASSVSTSPADETKPAPCSGNVGPYTGQDPTVKKPAWLRQRAPQGEKLAKLKESITTLKLNTVCEEAQCPNIGECWNGGGGAVKETALPPPRLCCWATLAPADAGSAQLLQAGILRQKTQPRKLRAGCGVFCVD